MLFTIINLIICISTPTTLLPPTCKVVQLTVGKTIVCLRSSLLSAFSIVGIHTRLSLLRTVPSNRWTFARHTYSHVECFGKRFWRIQRTMSACLCVCVCSCVCVCDRIDGRPTASSNGTAAASLHASNLSNFCIKIGKARSGGCTSHGNGIMFGLFEHPWDGRMATHRPHTEHQALGVILYRTQSRCCCDVRCRCVVDYFDGFTCVA